MFSVASTLEPHWFPDVIGSFFSQGSVFLNLRAFSNKSAIYHRLQSSMSTDQRTTNKTAPSVSHRRRQSPNIFGRYASPLHHQATSIPIWGRRQKKQPASAAYKDCEIHISINWRRSSSVSRMPRFSSTYVAHTHKLLANHLQTTVAYQINIVRDFDYLLFEKFLIYIAFLDIIGYHKVVQRRWLILILRWPIPRSRYLIRRLHQMSMFLALMLQEFRLEL